MRPSHCYSPRSEGGSRDSRKDIRGRSVWRATSKRPYRYIPSVNIRSFQQFSSVTEMLQTCPVLSAAEAELAVVMIEAARGVSLGGASVPEACMAGSGIAPDLKSWCSVVEEWIDGGGGCDVMRYLLLCARLGDSLAAFKAARSSEPHGGRARGEGGVRGGIISHTRVGRQKRRAPGATRSPFARPDESRGGVPYPIPT